jgi:uncharacterized protein (DUF983 family)
LPFSYYYSNGFFGTSDAVADVNNDGKVLLAGHRPATTFCIFVVARLCRALLQAVGLQLQNLLFTQQKILTPFLTFMVLFFIRSIKKIAECG